MPQSSRSHVGIWLLAIALIILAMVTIGGLTRLTGSGLSITEWDPIMGALPPLTHGQWAEAFAKYQKIPQFVLENRGMSLEAFKGIFWWEWSHRLLGRLLGVMFIVPFLWFAWTGAIKKSDWPRMLVLFLLGGLQGFIGWWMVESGLETRVSVSQYRLAIHLGTALLLLIAILWTALEYLRDASAMPASPARAERAGGAGGRSTDQVRRPEGVKSSRAVGFAALVYCQMLLGALVAGLHAGLIYNTWPDMNGRLLPEHPFFSKPWWINFFENPGLAQFDHRIGAYIVAGFALFIYARGLKLGGYAKFTAKLVAAITIFQVALGIVTLLLQAPEALAAFHQVTAATLLCAAVWHAYELKHYSAIA
ncbi:MAG TPA: COX15/CtaA family protein [Rhizomicrobium sp.]|jgi:cytochrome c oxidase assembly protein subunit 15|nr:COX15/CtaA family protein [Rhizomicrobium sp.]